MTRVEREHLPIYTSLLNEDSQKSVMNVAHIGVNLVFLSWFCASYDDSILLCILRMSVRLVGETFYLGPGDFWIIAHTIK